MEQKSSNDKPLPIPRSVMSSPSHMTTPVPAVITTTTTIRLNTDWSGIGGNGQSPNS